VPALELDLELGDVDAILDHLVPLDLPPAKRIGVDAADREPRVTSHVGQREDVGVFVRRAGADATKPIEFLVGVGNGGWLAPRSRPSRAPTDALGCAAGNKVVTLTMSAPKLRLTERNSCTPYLSFISWMAVGWGR
jgi:hypothetical protein